MTVEHLSVPMASKSHAEAWMKGEGYSFIRGKKVPASKWHKQTMANVVSTAKNQGREVVVLKEPTLIHRAPGTVTIPSKEFFTRVNKYIKADKIDFDAAVQKVRAQGFMPDTGKIFAPMYQHRFGLPGYSEDVTGTILNDLQKRIGRWHLDPVTRQIKSTMDRMNKEQYPTVHAALSNYRDSLLGRKSSGEIMVDRLLEQWAPEWLLERGKGFPTRRGIGWALHKSVHAKIGLFRISPAIVNKTQMLVNTATEIGPKYTRKGITASVTANKEIRRMLKSEGLELVVPKTELPGALMPRGFKDRFWDASLWFFNKSEYSNRTQTWLGAYLKGKEFHTMSESEAKKFAWAIVAKTQFLYSAVNRPELLRGTLLKVPTQFKMFMISEASFLYDLPFPKQLQALGTLTVLAGALGIPAARALDTLVQSVSSGLGVNGGVGISPLAELKKTYLDTMKGTDKERRVMQALAHGIPSVIGPGVDMSMRVGMGDFIPESADDLYGPIISTIVNVTKVLTTGGTPGAKALETMRAVAPGIAYPMEAAMTGEGKPLRARYEKYRPQYEPTGVERAILAAGFQPMRGVKQREISQVGGMEEGRKTALLSERIDNYVLSVVAKHPKAAQQKHMNEVIKFIRESGMMITAEELRNRIRYQFNMQSMVKEMRELRERSLPYRREAGGMYEIPNTE
ncbi:MAG: hypothetical protein ACXABY_26430, partial [Candidatus Thorarchaeota archaeon]|jgi:hypothetical protein